MADKTLKSLNFGGADNYFPLPLVTAADNDKILSVVNGEWVAAEAPSGGGSGPYKTLLRAGTDENGYTTYIPDQYPYEYIQNILSTKEMMLFFGIGVSIRPCIFVGFLQSQGPASVEFTYLDLGLGEAGFGYVDDKTGQITVDQPSSSFDSGLLDNAHIFYYDVL